MTTQRKRLARAALLIVRNLGVAAVAAVVGIAAVLLFRAATTERASFVSSSAPVRVAADESGYSVERVAAKVLPSVATLQVSNGDQGALGSGIILSPDGLILTNNHVVAAVGPGPQPSAHTVVILNDGRTAPFDVIAADPQTDVAVVRAHGLSGLTPISVGSSANLRVGQPVVAVGSPLGLAGTVTDGVISAVKRPVCTRVQIDSGLVAFDAIQTDAAINPGNSGGALVDTKGRLIGINAAEAVVSSAESPGAPQGSIGIGFAIPVDHAMRIAAELTTTGHASHAWLGAELSSDGAMRGASVADVAPGSPAEAAGLTPGSVVTKVDDQVIVGGYALVASMQSRAPHAPVTLAFIDSAGNARTAKVTLGTDQGRQ